MKKIKPCLWFPGNAGKAIEFYKSIFKNKVKVTGLQKRDGAILCAFFKIFDQEFMAINGPQDFKFTPAFSISLSCKDQSEVDYYWNKLKSSGGKESYCGWLYDRFGLSWQVTPKALGELMQRGNKAQSERVFQAMIKMRKIDVKTLKAAYNQK